MAEFKESYSDTAQQIMSMAGIDWENDRKTVIFVGGESGSGKTVTALALRDAIEEKYHRKLLILHQDDYFRLPPRANHFHRAEDIGRVGPEEVKLDLLQQHIYDFAAGKKSIKRPHSNAIEDRLEMREERLDDKDVLIIEGTYVLMLEGSRLNVFMSRDFRETLGSRQLRNRDIMDDFVEKVLEVEHGIIAPLVHKAHLVVGKDYEVVGGGGGPEQ